MLAFSRFTLRGLVAAGLIGVAASGSLAQVTPPRVDTRPIPWNPQFQNPAFPWHQHPTQTPNGNHRKNPILLMPSINTAPGIPASSIFRPAVRPPSWLNPALNNPWMNPVAVHPLRVNPFAMNPMFNNPFVLNPLLRNATFENPLNAPGFFPQTGFSQLGPSPLSPAVTYTPPVAIRQPGTLIYKGLDLQVNPTTGTVYQPISGVATLADGTTFYRVPGTGLPTATGTYATGTGLYYNPEGGTFFNPSSGVISKPGQTNVFLPYVW
jgi:hypothetical protein